MPARKILHDLGASLLQGSIKVVDLSATLGPDTPLMKLPPEIALDTPDVEIHNISHYDDNGPFWSWNWLKLGEHSGTHFDAPKHWVSGKHHENGSTDTIPVQNLIGPLCVIDCSREVAVDSDFLLTEDHIVAWEAEHGEIPEGAWVVMRSDWHKRNHDADAFLNTDENGSHTPGPTADCIRYLLSKGIMGWGNEGIGTDAGCAGGMEPPYPAHHLLHEANRYGLASLANLDQLPPTGAVIVVPPLKIKGGTGSPTRVLALVPASIDSV